jgi:hypothetical protein
MQYYSNMSKDINGFILLSQMNSESYLFLYLEHFQQYSYFLTQIRRKTLFFYFNCSLFQTFPSTTSLYIYIYIFYFI